jgi:hypothetical protein
MQLLWLVIDVIVGILLAGVVAPLALLSLPDQLRGPNVLIMASVTCVVVVSIFRRVLVGTPGLREKH